MTSCIAWRKSSYSSSSNDNCIEVAADWRKSTCSGTSGDNCVQVATAAPRVAVRDSKDPDGARLVFRPTEWRRFMRRVQDGTEAA
jgi:hypothetical protein